MPGGRRLSLGDRVAVTESGCAAGTVRPRTQASMNVTPGIALICAISER